ncbi:MAG: hypothetical protein JNM18_07500 [Planctomycetaceae bacterium]|nr:hypothetical protein [Planctomycetaceae bacterium]
MSFLFGSIGMAQEAAPLKLAAPADWGSETIKLPPGFAPDMKFTGVEHIRFAPGMMKPTSDSFFSYAFAFELEPQPALSEAVVKEEFLKYYRGLCTAVLKGKLPDLDTAAFKIALQRDATPAPAEQNAKIASTLQRYAGTLDWIEPFATQKLQQLKLEIWTWTGPNRNYVFACVSPQLLDAPIWRQLRAIRADYCQQ